MLSGALARSLSLSPPTVTGILDRLESRGLVKRVRQVDDKRTVTVSLTEAGRRLLEQAPPPLQLSFLVKLRALPEAEQAAIAATLKRLVSMMAAEEIDAAPLLAPGDAVAHGETRAALTDDR
jgi:DNA-binding MarR family transcriptional regulator